MGWFTAKQTFRKRYSAAAAQGYFAVYGKVTCSHFS